MAFEFSVIVVKIQQFQKIPVMLFRSIDDISNWQCLGANACFAALSNRSSGQNHDLPRDTCRIACRSYSTK